MPTTLQRALIVCALGYFIDVFDIQLFAVLRVQSLTELGVSADKLSLVSGYILNAQMLGMIIGAFLWGWLGDKFGRLKTLYGSIFIYSLGTFGCSFVHDPVTYGVLRFCTGLGLAGETGAAITLIAEMMTPQKRGWGITLMSGIGYLGPAFAVFISWFFPWRASYVAAGLIGLLLFGLRTRLTEPALFKKVNHHTHLLGSLAFLGQPRLLTTLICCIIIGVPFCYCWNVLNFFSAELSHAILADGEVFNQKFCLLVFYVGTSCGDFISGAISQLWSSRRKTTIAFLLLGVLGSISFLLVGAEVKLTAPVFYAAYFALGLVGGGWILFCMIAAEHFGTNIRATTSIVVVNVVRASVIPMTFGFQWFKNYTSVTNSAALVGVIVYVLAGLALMHIRETHGVDLDYIETMKKGNDDNHMTGYQNEASS